MITWGLGGALIEVDGCMDGWMGGNNNNNLLPILHLHLRLMLKQCVKQAHQRLGLHIIDLESRPRPRF